MKCCLIWTGGAMKELVIDADVDNLDKVLAFTEDYLSEMSCPQKVLIQLNIAVEEIFVNIAHYAYGSGKGLATIKYIPDDDGQGISISFEDTGMQFDPLAKEDPDTTLSAEERSIGGLGIYMVKKSMDDVRYEYTDGRNILTIYKKLFV